MTGVTLFLSDNIENMNIVCITYRNFRIKEPDCGHIELVPIL